MADVVPFAPRARTGAGASPEARPAEPPASAPAGRLVGDRLVGGRLVRLPEGLRLPEGDWSAPVVSADVPGGGFEGPIDLLLELVRRQEIPITEVRLSSITEQYLSTLAEMREMDLEPTSEFLVMAATLLYMKSREILPGGEGAEETEEEEIPAMELIRLLEEYERFKAAREALGKRFAERAKVYPRPVGATGTVYTADFSDLLKALKGVLSRLPPPEAATIARPKVRMEECMESLRRFLALKGEVAFEAIFPPHAGKPLVIVTFLALLELIRSGEVAAYQREENGPTWLAIRRPSEGPAASTEANA